MYAVIFYNFTVMRMLLTLLMLTAATAANAQSYQLIRDTTKPIPKAEMPMVDVKPKFKGNIGDYLAKNVKVMPDKGKKQIVMEFLVDTVGKVYNVEVKGKKPTDKHTAFEKEMIRVIKAMPAWIPGERAGKIVPVKYSLPVNL